MPRTPSFSQVKPLDVDDFKLLKLSSYIHWSQVFLSFMVLCMVAPIIATERKYYDGSLAAPNYTIIVAVLSIFSAAFFAFFPLWYQEHDQFRELGKFAMYPRNNMIFGLFFSLASAAATIACGVHSANSSNCNLDPALQKAFGDSYVSAWGTQCNLAKAATGFATLMTLVWLTVSGLSGFQHLNAKQRSLQNKLRQDKLHKEHQQPLSESAEDDQADDLNTAQPVNSPYTQTYDSPLYNESPALNSQYTSHYQAAAVDNYNQQQYGYDQAAPQYEMNAVPHQQPQDPHANSLAAAVDAAAYSAAQQHQYDSFSSYPTAAPSVPGPVASPEIYPPQGYEHYPPALSTAPHLSMPMPEYSYGHPQQ